MITPWRKRSPSEKALLIVLASALGMIFVVLTMSNGPLFALKVVALFTVIPLGLVMAILGVLIAIVGVHELGHYIAGRLVGLRFYSLKVGPFLWQNTGSRVRFSYEKTSQLAGGYAAMGPTDQENLLRKHRLFILGGPIASLLLVALIWVGLPWQHALWGDRKGESFLQLGFNMLVTLIALYAVYFAALSVIPFRIRGFYNDAAQFLLPFFSRSQAEYRVLAWRWASEHSSGKKCADWDRDVLRSLRDQATSPFEKAVHSHHLGNSLLYSDSIGEGLAELEKSYAYLSKPTKLLVEFECAMALDVAFARAYFGRDGQGAKEALEKAETMTAKPSYGHHRARAAIALLEGDSTSVIQHCEAAKKWLDEHADRERPIIEACYEEMDRLEREAA